MKSVRIKAYAKLNLALDVLGTRSDGYHEVEMIMQGLSLHDVLVVTGQEEGISLTCSTDKLEGGPANLAWQAAELLRRDFDEIRGVKISLTKNIPLAAGLAGGSADAAAVLLALDEIYGLRLGREKLLAYAARLGSDVPFCLLPLTALACGRGEKISMLPSGPRLWMALAKPPFGVSTKEAYRRLDEVAVAERPDLRLALSALAAKNCSALYKAMGNVLEYAAFDLYPDLREWSRLLIKLGAVKVLMSGSGPTLAAFCENRRAAERLAEKWPDSDWEIIICRTIKDEDLSKRIREG